MKLDFNQSNVHEMIGMGEAQVSQMKASPLAFDILSKRIYKNKVKAPIQELACNAKDAHVMAGTPNRPIEVKLPNSLDPEFYVKDWGPGLSEDEVKNLYMTYFMSTKSESDDFTGAFGLGSKSPFCYVDQFWVTSAQNGIQTTYLAFKNNQGVPSISKVEGSTGPAPDDWQHGLRVGFPAAAEDFSRFSEEAANVFRWFDVKPKVKGSYKPQTDQAVMSHEHFLVLPNAQAFNRYHNVPEDSFVQMGSVGYRVEDDAGLLNQLSAAKKGLLKCGIVLKVGIGTVSVTASRESLEYDPLTINAIDKHLDLVIDALVNHAANVIGVDSSSRNLNDILNGLSVFRKHLLVSEWQNFVAEAVHAKLKAQKPDFDLTAKAVGELMHQTYQTLPGWVGAGDAIGVSVFVNAKRGLTQKAVKDGYIGNTAATVSLTKGNIAVVVDDVTYAANRCKAALESGIYGEIFFVSGKDKAQKQEMAERISAHFCHIPVIAASSLPRGKEPERSARAAGAGGSRQKIDDRLSFFADEQVNLFVGGTQKVVRLEEALKQTSTYLTGNFTTSSVRNFTGSGSICFEDLRTVLRNVTCLHEGISEQKLDAVIVFSSSQVQKLRVQQSLKQWDLELLEFLRENKAEIKKHLLALPGYLIGTRHGTYRSQSSDAKAMENALTTHLVSWLGDRRAWTTLRGDASQRFLDVFLHALEPGVKVVVLRIAEALGYELAKGPQEQPAYSSSEKAWEFLRFFTQLIPDEQEVLKPLLKAIECGRDKEFYSLVKSKTEFFKSLDTHGAFVRMLQDSPSDAAKVYNALWNLGEEAASVGLKLVA